MWLINISSSSCICKNKDLITKIGLFVGALVLYIYIYIYIHTHTYILTPNFGKINFCYAVQKTFKIEVKKVKIDLCGSF